jgi:isochorismate hydrolase
VKIKRSNAAFVLVDVQQKLFDAVSGKSTLEQNLVKLLRVLALFETELFVNEQYKKGIGETIAPLQPFLKSAQFFEKTTFSAFDNEIFANAIDRCGKKQLIIAGTEAHVCVMQSALDAKAMGYEVYIVEDCCGSRKPNDKTYAIQRMAQNGVYVTTYESVLFELAKDSKNPRFKAMLEIVK